MEEEYLYLTAFVSAILAGVGRAAVCISSATSVSCPLFVRSAMCAQDMARICVQGVREPVAYLRLRTCDSKHWKDYVQRY